jgi:addiction module RelE/StbE family toxin
MGDKEFFFAYKIHVANKNTEKKLNEYLEIRSDIRNKLDLLKNDPKGSNGAHKLHGRLNGKWACWLGSNIRMIYSIEDEKRIIYIEAVGTHKIY